MFINAYSYDVSTRFCKRFSSVAKKIKRRRSKLFATVQLSSDYVYVFNRMLEENPPF